jgi:hypothetical protein
MRDKGNFSELISILDEDISYFQRAISSGEAKPERHRGLRSAIFESLLDIAQAHYSNGASKAIVKEAVLRCIPAFQESFEFVNGFGQYDEIIWLISLAILSDISSEDFKEITEILKRDNVNDQLLSLIIKSKDSTWESSNGKVIQTHPYEKATQLDSAQDIKYYLDKVWYQGHSDAAWYDTHKNTKVNCYSGYWAWEAAAIAKIKGIDDGSLKKQKYYPYDAVHW